MDNRIITFGCSHVFGAEVSQKNVVYSQDVYKKNFGKQIADQLNLPFTQAAYPGNSNDHIMHDVMQHLKQGDIAIVGWSYTNRFRYISQTNNDAVPSSIMTVWEMTAPLADKNLWDKAVDMRNKLGWKQNKKLVQEEMENSLWHSRDHLPILKSKNRSLAQALSDWYLHVYSNITYRFNNFLEQYNTVQCVARSRNAQIINFHYDMEEDIYNELRNPLQVLNNNFFPQRNNNSNELCSDLVEQTFNITQSKLYQDYIKDTNLISWNTTFKSWAMENIYNKKHWQWPDNCESHLDYRAHDYLRECLIKELKDRNYV